MAKIGIERNKWTCHVNCWLVPTMKFHGQTQIHQPNDTSPSNPWSVKRIQTIPYIPFQKRFYVCFVTFCFQQMRPKPNVLILFRFLHKTTMAPTPKLRTPHTTNHGAPRRTRSRCGAPRLTVRRKLRRTCNRPRFSPCHPGKPWRSQNAQRNAFQKMYA